MQVGAHALRVGLGWEAPGIVELAARPLLALLSPDMHRASSGTDASVRQRQSSAANRDLRGFAIRCKLAITAVFSGLRRPWRIRG